MKLSALIEQAKKEKQEPVSLWDMTEYFNIFESLDYNGGESRFTEVFITKFYDSDTCVGTKAYFFDGEFVATGVQTGRKSSENFFWASTKAYQEVKQYIQSFIERELESIPLFEDEEVPDFYKVYHSSTILRSHKLFYKGELVSLDPACLPTSCFDRTVNVMTSTGSKLMSVTDLDIAYF